MSRSAVSGNPLRCLVRSRSLRHGASTMAPAVNTLDLVESVGD